MTPISSGYFSSFEISDTFFFCCRQRYVCVTFGSALYIYFVDFMFVAGGAATGVDTPEDLERTRRLFAARA